MRTFLKWSASLALLAAVASVSAADPGNATRLDFSRCTATVMHPLSVHVTALDPVARGAVVRLRVTATSAVALDHAELRMTSTGGAANRGVTNIELGSLAPGRPAQGVFTLAVPASGGRQYVQFAASGSGSRGRLSRGGCYNLLPDGPAEAGRLVITPRGGRVLEVTAGRIGQ